MRLWSYEHLLRQSPGSCRAWASPYTTTAEEPYPADVEERRPKKDAFRFPHIISRRIARGEFGPGIASMKEGELSAQLGRDHSHRIIMLDQKRSVALVDDGCSLYRFYFRFFIFISPPPPPPPLDLFLSQVFCFTH